MSESEVEYYSELYEEYYSLPEKNPMALFWWCIFCFSTALTIGYGNFTPRTEVGQLFAICFSFLAMILFISFMLDFLNSNDLTLKMLKQYLHKRFKGRGWTEEFALSVAYKVKFTISWTITLTLVCICLVAISREEEWTLLQTVYFMWVSVCTIGYGDFVPNSEQDSTMDWYAIVLLLIIP
eukprot:UN25843